MPGFEEHFALLDATIPRVFAAAEVAITAELQDWFQASQALVPVGTPDPLGRNETYEPGALKASGRIILPEIDGNTVQGAVSYGDDTTLTVDGHSTAVMTHEGTPSHPIHTDKPHGLVFLYRGTQFHGHDVTHPGTQPMKWLEHPVLDSIEGMEDRLGSVFAGAFGSES